jgi:hypothetical protein
VRVGGGLVVGLGWYVIVLWGRVGVGVLGWEEYWWCVLVGLRGRGDMCVDGEFGGVWGGGMV